MPTTTIPAQTGAYVHLKRGQRLKLINTHGNQVIDFWAFTFPPLDDRGVPLIPCVSRSMIREDRPTHPTPNSPFPFVSGVQYFSASRTRSVLSKLVPSAKDHDVLYSNKTVPMFTFLEDTTSGVHDTLFGCCDRFRYHQLEVGDYCHASCSENMHLALREAAKAGVFAEHSISPEWTPDPLNIFMNVPIVTGLRREEGGGRIESVPPESRPGEYVVLQAQCDVLAVMSACPNDVIPGVNGSKCVDVEYEVLG